MSADEQTIAFYDRDAAAYAQSAIAHGVRPSLEAFEALLPRASHVLDLGCGGGHEAAWLAARGHAVTAQDASEGLAAEARERFGVCVRIGDFTTIPEVAAFDGVWSGAALHHAARHDLPVIVDAIARALRPGGHFAGNAKCGEDRRDGLGRFYCALSAPSARALFGAEAWADVTVRESVGAGYDGVDTPWIVITARRR
ncbi:MAG: class I SAM-dependent methyltransferase [Hyphomonadaceae bacterium]|nr:class I SAM-dependent methyltransferase [Hyphomonadaceae bacterium]